jgi:hypothetical protein
MFELKKRRKNIPSGFCYDCFYSSAAVGLDHEAGVEYCSFGIQDRDLV